MNKKKLEHDVQVFFQKDTFKFKKKCIFAMSIKKKQRTMKRQNGQHRIVEVPFSDKIMNVIVREYDFPSTVSYIETADSHLAARKARLSANNPRNL